MDSIKNSKIARKIDKGYKIIEILMQSLPPQTFVSTA